VYYAAAGNSEVPDFVEESTFDLLGVPYLYIEVFSPNKDAVQFYKIHVNVATPRVSALSLIFPSWVDGKGNVVTVEKPVTLGTPGDTYATAGSSTFSVGASKLPANISILANVEQPLTTLKYAVTANADAAPAFSDADAAYQNVSINDGSVVHVEGTGSDGETQFFYKVAITAVGDAITGLTVGGIAASLGTPGTLDGVNLGDGGTAGAVTLTGAQAGASVTVAAAGVPAGVTARYALASLGLDFKGNAEIQSPTEWKADGVFASGVTSDLGPLPIYVELAAAGYGQLNVYKIDVTVE
jgi:hypothetical protein